MNGVFMLTDERYKQLMEDVGLPNSRSLLQALNQCAMEAVLSERAVLAKAGEQVFAWGSEDGRVITKSAKSVKATADIFNIPLYAHPLPAMPDNYVSAPLEPTDAMIDAGVAMALQVSVHGKGGWSKYITGLYKQMIAARPKPEGSQ